MTDTALQRFKKFKASIISVDIPGDLLLELVESYIFGDEPGDNENLAVKDGIPVLDGQLSLFDPANV